MAVLSKTGVISGWQNTTAVWAGKSFLAPPDAATAKIFCFLKQAREKGAESAIFPSGVTNHGDAGGDDMACVMEPKQTL